MKEATEKSTGLSSTYNKSQLVTGQHAGVDLGCNYYRVNNITRVNSFFAVAIEKQATLYFFELLDDSEAQRICQSLPKGSQYLKRKFKGFSNVVISAEEGMADVLSGVVNEYSTDFMLTNAVHLDRKNTGTDVVLQQCYSLAIHTDYIDRATHSKEFTASDTKADDKGKSVCFEKFPVLTKVRS